MRKSFSLTSFLPLHFLGTKYKTRLLKYLYYPLYNVVSTDLQLSTKVKNKKLSDAEQLNNFSISLFFISSLAGKTWNLIENMALHILISLVPP